MPTAETRSFAKGETLSMEGEAATTVKTPEETTVFTQDAYRAKAKIEKSKAEKIVPQPFTPPPQATTTPQANIQPQNIELPPATRQITLQQLVDQIASHITTMTTKNLQEITVEIKYPPVFAGAKLTIQQYQQARGEFNITFDNLTPQARSLIESNVQQRRLNDALVEKGYKIHIISIEAPSIRPAVFTESGPTDYSKQEKSSDQGAGQQGAGQQGSSFYEGGQQQRPR